MNKETHAIPITLVLPRYEVMVVIHALQKWADLEYRQAPSSSSESIAALADKIYAVTREHVMAFEDQHEEENPN